MKATPALKMNISMKYWTIQMHDICVNYFIAIFIDTYARLSQVFDSFCRD